MKPFLFFIAIFLSISICPVYGAELIYDNASWWDTNYEIKENYYISNATQYDNIKVTTVFNKSDRWVFNNTSELSFYHMDDDTVWIRLPEGSYYIQKYINKSNSYPHVSSCSGTLAWCDTFNNDLDNWTISGNVVLDGGRMKITGANTWNSNAAASDTAFTLFDRNKSIYYKIYSPSYYHGMYGFSSYPFSIDKGIYWNMHTNGYYYSRVDSASTLNGTYATGINYQDLYYNASSGYRLDLNSVIKASDPGYNNPQGADRIVMQVYSAGSVYFDEIFIANTSQATITHLADYEYSTITPQGPYTNDEIDALIEKSVDTGMIFDLIELLIIFAYIKRKTGESRMI